MRNHSRGHVLEDAHDEEDRDAVDDAIGVVGCHREGEQRERDDDKNRHDQLIDQGERVLKHESERRDGVGVAGAAVCRTGARDRSASDARVRGFDTSACPPYVILDIVAVTFFKAYST